MLYLFEFSIQLIHQPRTQIVVADTLSRQPDHMEGIKNDNTDLIMLLPHLFSSHISSPVKYVISLDSLIYPIDLDLQTCLCTALYSDQVA